MGPSSWSVTLAPSQAGRRSVCTFSWCLLEAFTCKGSLAPLCVLPSYPLASGRCHWLRRYDPTCHLSLLSLPEAMRSSWPDPWDINGKHAPSLPGQRPYASSIETEQIRKYRLQSPSLEELRPHTTVGSSTNLKYACPSFSLPNTWTHTLKESPGVHLWITSHEQFPGCSQTSRGWGSVCWGLFTSELLPGSNPLQNRLPLDLWSDLGGFIPTRPSLKSLSSGSEVVGWV